MKVGIDTVNAYKLSGLLKQFKLSPMDSVPQSTGNNNTFDSYLQRKQNISYKTRRKPGEKASQAGVQQLNLPHSKNFVHSNLSVLVNNSKTSLHKIKPVDGDEMAGQKKPDGSKAGSNKEYATPVFKSRKVKSVRVSDEEDGFLPWERQHVFRDLQKVWCMIIFLCC